MSSIRDSVFNWIAVLLLVSLIPPAIAVGQRQFPKNSTTKNRIKPGPLSSKIGSGVQWRQNLAAAVKESKETGKPVFWYVPTVRGTFMDRKDSIDRYMLAGPFSWPATIELLNRHFVPVKAAPGQAQQQAYELKPYVFVEPGFVILNSDETLLAKCDRLTTLHHDWMLSMLSSYLKAATIELQPSQLSDLWKKFADRDFQGIQFPDKETVESLLLAGMVDFRNGHHEAAKLKWERASHLDETDPLAWKAAAEAEGFGPFVRGFEVFDHLPAEVRDAAAKGINHLGSAAPTGVYAECDLWKRGVNFLLDMQAADGGWHDSDYDFGGTDSLPNVRAAVTSIAGMALLDAQKVGKLDQATVLRIKDAIHRAFNYVQDNRNLNLDDRDEIFWAFAYRVRFLSRLMEQDAEMQPILVAAVKDLESIQTATGGWFHEYPNPMATGLALQAFSESAKVGAPASEETISRGTESITGDRFGNGAFSYYTARGQRQTPKGNESHLWQAAGRMPLCELGLWLHKRSTMEALTNAVKKSFDLSEPLMTALKYDNHTSNYAYGGFFIWYDIEARGEAILKLEDPQTKAKYQAMQRELILSLPEIDGCFVDSHELGRVYGTAMGLLSLAKTRQ